MAITIGWKDTEGRKCPERLDIDPDHKELLCHSRLPQPTLSRVREALQERWENPWT